MVEIWCLSQIPEMFPVLKQAEFVGSGGQGLIQVVIGRHEGLLERSRLVEASSVRQLWIARLPGISCRSSGVRCIWDLTPSEIR